MEEYALKDQPRPINLLIRGYHYNHVGASKQALEYLEEAHSLEPQLDKLAFELAFAYNATQQYQKAIDFIQKALQYEPKNAMLYRELGFAQIYSEQYKAAEKSYKKGIALSQDSFQKSEMAFNMARGYLLQGNKKKFETWAKLTRKYAEPDNPYIQYIENWERELMKQ